MKFFPKPTRLILYSNLSPEECGSRLAQAIDPERPSFLSFTGYSGSKLFLGTVEGRQFRIFERTLTRNVPLIPILSGEFQPKGGGTRIEGAFDLDRGAKLALGFLAVVAPLFSVIIYVSMQRKDAPAGVATAIACTELIAALLLPRILRAIGTGQERDIADFLTFKLEAGEDAAAFKSG
jgi:hypothetical protein